MIKYLVIFFLFALSANTYAQPVLITGSQQPYPVTGFQIAPNDSQFVHAIGIYEANSNHGFGNNPRYNASVVVDAQGSNSLYLVLSSYEPVNWIFSGAGLGAVRGVLIAGYNQHTFTGINTSLVDNVSGIPAFFLPSCYEINNCGGLLAFASTRIGDQVDSLIGSYNANAFLVQATAVAGVPEPASWAMLVIGFGFLGGMMRKRRKHSIATQAAIAHP
jgi:PEP-CTERM motif